MMAATAAVTASMELEEAAESATLPLMAASMAPPISTDVESMAAEEATEEPNLTTPTAASAATSSRAPAPPNDDDSDLPAPRLMITQMVRCGGSVFAWLLTKSINPPSFVPLGNSHVPLSTFLSGP